MMGHRWLAGMHETLPRTSLRLFLCVEFAF
jgi:hypothetical protein